MGFIFFFGWFVLSFLLIFISFFKCFYYFVIIYTIGHKSSFLFIYQFLSCALFYSTLYFYKFIYLCYIEALSILYRTHRHTDQSCDYMECWLYNALSIGGYSWHRTTHLYILVNLENIKNSCWFLFFLVKNKFIAKNKESSYGKTYTLIRPQL